MPLIYTAPSSTASETVTSSDSILTAVTNPSKAGVLLRAVFTGTQPPTVTFYRTDSAGVKVVVRSGDPAPLISGTAFAYDHEARPGVAYSYTVKGAAESTAAVVTVPWVGDAWVKSVTAPTLSVKARLLAPFDEAFPSRNSLADALGAAAPYVSLETEASLRGTLLVRTKGKAEHDALSASLRSGGVLLVQGTDDHGLPADFYVVPVGREVRRAGDLPGWDARDTAVSVVVVDRPLTSGAPLLMPGWGWTEATAGFASMTEVQAAYPTMWDMLKAGVA